MNGVQLIMTYNFKEHNIGYQMKQWITNRTINTAKTVFCDKHMPNLKTNSLSMMNDSTWYKN